MNPQLQLMLQQAIQAFQSGNLDRADSILKKVIQADSKNLPALHVLGLIKASQANYREAADFLGRAARIHPNDASIQYNLAKALIDCGLDNASIPHHQKAVELAPNNPEAWLNYGKTVTKLNRYDEALVLYDKALSLNPNYSEAALNKGVTLKELNRYEEAIECAEFALKINPNFAEAWTNMGVVLKQLKRYDQAIFCFDRALAVKSDIEWVYGDLLHTKMKICSWNNLEKDIKNLTDKIYAQFKVAQPFALLSLTDDALLHKKASEIYAQDKYPVNLSLGPILKHPKKEKIRLGYFSPDFRDHAVALLTAELFEIHDRSRFEVFAFSLRRGQDTDAVKIRLKKGFDTFIDAENMSDLEIAQLARKLEIDIAIDLAGCTQYSRTGIFSYRTAPIQVNWLGYAGTIGANFIDYIIADSTIIPESNQQFYSEKVVHLPHTYMVDDSKRISSSKVFTKQECCLPENSFVFCCFNNDYKFNKKILESWSRILLRVEDSVLWISENNEQFKLNIKSEFEKLDIDSSRIIFAQRIDLMADHLARYALADLFLDTYPYNAHTTALDSLKAGIPVITKLGQSFASRVASSLLRAVDLSELITTTQEEYEALAIGLATSPNRLSSIKQKLVNKRLDAPLFDTALFAGGLESSYIKMYDRYQADLPPEHIYIKTES